MAFRKRGLTHKFYNGFFTQATSIPLYALMSWAKQDQERYDLILEGIIAILEKIDVLSRITIFQDLAKEAAFSERMVKQTLENLDTLLLSKTYLVRKLMLESG